MWIMSTSDRSQDHASPRRREARNRRRDHGAVVGTAERRLPTTAERRLP